MLVTQTLRTLRDHVRILASTEPLSLMVEAFHGILNINKPPRWTSHDVVARVRRLLGLKRAGHAGTLDPLATGVLLVCLGQATRVAEYLMTGEKVYRASARLGITTDTYDIDGKITASTPVPAFSRQELLGALALFVGQTTQTPPPFSAIKKQGVRAYQKARRGEEVQLAPRPVRIHRIELQEWQPPTLTIEVSCDPGTYIRSLAHDLGQLLHCGAVLSALTRTQSGAFTLSDAITMEDLTTAVAESQVARHLHPLTAALGALTPVMIDATAGLRLLQGRSIPCSSAPSTRLGYAQEPDGTVRAILRYEPATGLWWPKKTFSPNCDQAS